MNTDKLSSMKLVPLMDAQFTRNRFFGKRRMGLYPSEGSVISTHPATGKKEVIGGCHRSSWYRIFGIPKTNPPGVKSQYIFAFGNMIEDMITSLIKQSGVYNGNSVKFYDETLRVSGEIDVVVDHPDGGYIFVECKSTHGYHKEAQLCDTKKSKGRPQDSHILQIGTYLWSNREDPDLVGGKLLYILRDNMTRVEFDVCIVEEGDKHRFVINGDIEERFYVEDMVDRYLELQKHISKTITALRDNEGKEDFDIMNMAPPRDYVMAYTDHQIEEKFELGEISKSKYEEFQKKSIRPGDWQCSYCDYRECCWTQKDIDTYTGKRNSKATTGKKRVADKVMKKK